LNPYWRANDREIVTRTIFFRGLDDRGLFQDRLLARKAVPGKIASVFSGDDLLDVS
jgi:hypothetical protein